VRVTVLLLTTYYSPGEDVVVGDHLSMLRALHLERPRRDAGGEHHSVEPLEIGGAHTRAELHLVRVRVRVRVRVWVGVRARVRVRVRVRVWVGVRVKVIVRLAWTVTPLSLSSLLK